MLLEIIKQEQEKVKCGNEPEEYYYDGNSGKFKCLYKSRCDFNNRGVCEYFNTIGRRIQDEFYALRQKRNK